MGTAPLPTPPPPLYFGQEEPADPWLPELLALRGWEKAGQAVGMQGSWQAAVHRVDQQGGGMHRH